MKKRKISCIKEAIKKKKSGHKFKSMKATEFLPSTFFDLSTFEMKALFSASRPVWEVIKQIDPFLKTLSLGKIEVDIPTGCFLVDPHLITICDGCVIEPGAYIKGPCYLGKGTTVRHGAYIRGNVITGEHCVIGHDTEIKNSVMLNKAHAAHFAYIGDSILGNEVNLGAGTKCANLKLDNKEVLIHRSGEKISTGLRKLGAIIGDRTQIGCNTVTNPGTLIGPDVLCYPVLNVCGVIPAKMVVKNSSGVQMIPRHEGA